MSEIQKSWGSPFPIFHFTHFFGFYSQIIFLYFRYFLLTISIEALWKYTDFLPHLLSHSFFSFFSYVSYSNLFSFQYILFPSPLCSFCYLLYTLTILTGTVLSQFTLLCHSILTLLLLLLFESSGMSLNLNIKEYQILFFTEPWQQKKFIWIKYESSTLSSTIAFT